MRCDQFMGLPKEARDFLERYQEVPDPCPHCNRPFLPKIEEIGTYFGMFSDEYPLSRHFLKNGCTADEFLQASPWSSGPVHFLGLKVSDGTVFEWAQEDIDKA
jgi:hypothetical protein